ncbi:nucleotide sugar dehydrogenase [Allosphingosinicella indica]|uniref:UDP-N-acetyl-D-galactosamine dehydrogenase n=1 Tax=Allosphingosinicella indica TaxID=941907 RepID=A0A1X7G1F0_9SPHN|nr:nucleotide sugar dehydrogenase [Allosphingosinicella indica]SMF62266.1 UDP-N-acetyl-D-galactosamine dehydrogenase [Allosphingosinicella indica]
MNASGNLRIVVLGLGYVGLPLAVALSRHFDVTGLDIDRSRVAELERHHDRTAEVSADELARSALSYTADPEDCRGADLFIVTVPTPVDETNRPDLAAMQGASRTVAKLLDPARRPIVVYESTVYPGVTEDICGPLLAEESGLVRGRDFFLGYSPERINPGDREHRIETIVKVVAGENPDVTEVLADVYGAVTSAGVFRAASIKVAEAAKVIENAQRDINIAFMNEIAQIFARLDVSVWDVLDAAGTKWNFLPFQPGLVGGHCIGVDPYYLSHRAQELGHDPQIILAGRSTNDGMGRWVAEQLHERRGKAGSVLVLGLTFKEDVPDLRNSRVIDVVRALAELGHAITIHDPLADPEEAAHEYGVSLDADGLAGVYDMVIAAVPHQMYRGLDAGKIRRLINEGGTLADLKGVWRDHDLGDIDRWSL